MRREINARYAGTCQCARQFAQGARVTYDTTFKRIVACYDCRKPEIAEDRHHAMTKAWMDEYEPSCF